MTHGVTFTKEALNYLVEFYVETRDNQSEKGDFEDFKKPVFSTKDLIKIKEEAIKRAEEKGQKIISLEDVKLILNCTQKEEKMQPKLEKLKEKLKKAEMQLAETKEEVVKKERRAYIRDLKEEIKEEENGK